MVVFFVRTPQFRRIALWVAMETMHLNIARISFVMKTIFGGKSGVPMNNLTPMKTYSGVAR